jgi:hypothetical protein
MPRPNIDQTCQTKPHLPYVRSRVRTRHTPHALVVGSAAGPSARDQAGRGRGAPPLCRRGGTLRRTLAGDLELPVPIALCPTIGRRRCNGLAELPFRIATEAAGVRFGLSSLGVKERVQHARAVVGVARFGERAGIVDRGSS